jgi:hypothetical protein
MINIYSDMAKALSGRSDVLSNTLLVFWVGVSCVGFILWLYTYVLAMKFGRAHKSYAVPCLAICLNFGWEFLATFVWNMKFEIWHIGCLLWMLFDVVIVYQLLRYGARVQVIPELRDNFKWLIPLTFVLCAVGQFTFALWAQDSMGIVDSFLINLVMSISFIFMYFTRREADDLTYGVAWYKMLGTGIVSVSMIPLFPLLYPNSNTSFMWFLCPLIFVVDCVYIGLLAKARRAARSGDQSGVSEQPATAIAA